MSKVQDHLIIIKNKETGEVYHTTKNRKQVERKIEDVYKRQVQMIPGG